MPPPPSGLPGLIIAAPSSGSGKTTVTLGLLRALRRRGRRVASVKVGPDYIDPQFHAAASGGPCVSLDGWAMRPASRDALIRGLDGDLVIVEGVMGLFDGALVTAAGGDDGSTAALAAQTGWPVVLVLDVSGQTGSAAAVARGFATHRPDIEVAGVILNRVGGPRHEAALRQAFAALGEPPLLGCLPRRAELTVPHRHLGLVQAEEHIALDQLVTATANEIETHVDVATLETMCRLPRLPLPEAGWERPPLLPAPGRHVAVAQDRAFAFSYPAQLAVWRDSGVELSTFSPLDDQAPRPEADVVLLPGGYPELHAGRLAGNARFLGGLRAAAERGARVVGECGGYMVLGEALIDADGTAHAMAGLLPLTTSFATRRLHLGYRRAIAAADGPWGPAGTAVRGHEFHYATTVHENGAAAFHASDAAGSPLGPMGLVRGRVMGSFLHAIDVE